MPPHGDQAAQTDGMKPWRHGIATSVSWRGIAIYLAESSPCLSSDERRGAVPRSELRSVATQPIVSAAVADTPKLARRCAPVESNVNISTADRYFMKW